ncbi:MAG: NADP oxidoreductase [Elusimicrobia bacterium]|nr:NADP oxidoreductase [Elusimicrobiota bacterium]
MNTLGTPQQPLWIAIIGSGPSAFYAAEALLKQKDVAMRIDMFDRLPTPYGLVRGGVAPDHQKIKNVTAVYERVAAAEAFRFFGNTHVGRSISTDDLRRHYHQIVYAVGNETDRRLGVPGEDLAGSHSATAFVGWYNGHPDYQGSSFDLSVERAAVIGIGNVAIDVTRILAQDPERLASTDIAAYALEALRKSRVREIYLLGRRGPAQAAYSPAEIREIGELESADLVVLPNEAELDESSKPDTADPEAKKNVDYVQEISRRGEGSKPRKVRLRFCASPVELIGENGRVQALRIEKNRLVRDDSGKVSARGAGEFEMLPIGLVFRSVGYRGVPIPGVPFDEKDGRISNAEGRVLNPATKSPLQGEYAVGWAKRGPTGLIGTNRADSVATVKAMVEDAKTGRVRSQAAAADPAAIPQLLKSKNVRYVTFQDWKRLDALELARGKTLGKIRDKFTRVDEMLAALNGSANQP